MTEIIASNYANVDGELELEKKRVYTWELNRRTFIA